MGKAQKFKQQRKLERAQTAQRKIRKKRIAKKSVITLFVALIFSGLLFFGGQKVYSIFNNKKETNMETQAKGYKTGERQYSQAPEMQIDTNKTYTALFETNMGNFKAELFAKNAPKTINNFVVLARDKFYDGLTFHRIIKDFMIQGGDPKGDGTGDPGYKFEDEFWDQKLVKGVLAMANSGPNTNGSQFFVITAEATDWLDGKHTPFGKIVEGLDVIEKIGVAETGEGDRPKEAVIISEITIEEK